MTRLTSRELGANLITRKPSLGFLVAGILLAISSISLGWLTPNFDIEGNSLFAILRLTEFGRLIGVCSLFLGALLLTIMWLNIEHEAHTPSQLARFALSSSLPSLLVPPLFSRDVYSYIAQGHLQLAGFNPYQHGVSKLNHWFYFGIDPMWAETTTPYGAAFLLIEKFSASLSIDNPYTSMVFLRAVNIAAFIVTIYGINRLANIHNISSNFAIWLAVLNPITILHLINAVHNDSIMIAGLVWAFVFAHESRLVKASLAIAFAIAIKPIALVALPFLAVAKSSKYDFAGRVKDWAISFTIAGSALTLLGIITQTGFGWINAFSTPGAVLNLAAPISFISQLLSTLFSWFGLDLSSSIFSAMRIFGLIVSVLLVLRLTLDKQDISGTRKAGIALVCMIFFSPVVFPWYFLWPLALFAGSGLQTVRSIKIAVYGTLLVVAYSIVEAVVVRDSAITSTEILFSIAVLASVFSVMKFKENHEIFDLEQVRVS